MDQSPDLRRLESFIAVAEAGGIGKAARRLGIAQPSLSQQMLRLEEELGVVLLDRLGRGVALTEAGRALLPRARRLVGEARALGERLRTELEAGGGRLAVGAIPTMAPYLLPGVVAHLRRESPGCEIAVREDLTQNLVEALADNELDVAVMSTPIESQVVELEVVGREAMLVVVPAGHPLREGGGVGLGDLRDLPTVTLHEMHCLGRQIGDFCAAKRLGRTITCRMTQIDTLLEFVRLGLGVSIVPAMVAGHDRSPERAYVEFRSRAPTRDIALAWRVGRSRSRLARRFAGLLGEAVA
ncbi:MAG: LysR family transcriptional regulator [Phycisphaerales bacterium]